MNKTDILYALEIIKEDCELLDQLSSLDLDRLAQLVANTALVMADDSKRIQSRTNTFSVKEHMKLLVEIEAITQKLENFRR